MEVTRHDELSTEYKKDVLKAWEEDATHLAIAEGEGMGGGEPNRLADVADAKGKLNADAAPGPAESDVIVLPLR
jgi:hypothetical protein